MPFAVAKAADPDPGDTLAFAWAFDDGATATGAQVAHAFAAPGVHTATVTATDPTGLTAASTVSVEVVVAPTRPVRDTTAPVISRLKVTPSRFRATSRAARIARRAPRGTRITLTLSEAATLGLTFEQELAGHRVHGHCRATGQGRRCTITRKLHGSVTLRGVAAGRRAIRFYGRLGHHALQPGRYRLTLTATDAAGNRSRPARATFTVA